jgi:hypothetical protein
MNAAPHHPGPERPAEDQTSEMLILPDGKVLVHNLTPVMATLLSELNPAEAQIRDRVVPPPRAPSGT